MLTRRSRTGVGAIRIHPVSDILRTSIRFLLYFSFYIYLCGIISGAHEMRVRMPVNNNFWIKSGSSTSRRYLHTLCQSYASGILVVS